MESVVQPSLVLNQLHSQMVLVILVQLLDLVQLEPILSIILGDVADKMDDLKAQYVRRAIL
jgi:hypothetical protein